MSIPYLPLYVADYEADTAHLSVAEDGAFNRLLRLCWRTPGCSIPNEHDWIKRRVRATDDEWEAIFLPVIEEFFRVRNARLFSPRLLAEYERIRATSNARSAAGKKGGRPRKPLKTTEDVKSPAKANGKHLDLDLEVEREKEEANASSKKRGSRLPSDWRLPRAWGEWAVEFGLTKAEVRTQADRFKDYFLGVSGQKGVKADWLATWRNWCRKALDDRARRRAPPSNDDRLRAWGITDHDEDNPRNFSRGGDRGRPPVRDTESHVPDMFPDPPEEGRSVLERDLQAGRPGLAVPSLRLVGGSVL